MLTVWFFWYEIDRDMRGSDEVWVVCDSCGGLGTFGTVNTFEVAEGLCHPRSDMIIWLDRLIVAGILIKRSGYGAGSQGP